MMKISAVVGVMEEAALIGPCIAALRRAGVASIDVLDDGSADGTREIVAQMEAAGAARLLPVLPSYERLMAMDGPLFAPILAREAPDFVLFTDADELWLTAAEGLAGSATLTGADIVSVARLNVAPGLDGIDAAGLTDPEHLARLDLIARRRHLTAADLQDDPSLRWIEHQLPSKVIARPDKVSALSTGGHRGIARDGVEPRIASAQDMVIAHLPFTTWPRFARKIANAEAMLAEIDVTSLGQTGWHWRRWVTMKQEGRLEEEFARQCYTPEDLATLRQEGAVIRAGEMLEHGV